MMGLRTVIRTRMAARIMAVRIMAARTEEARRWAAYQAWVDFMLLRMARMARMATAHTARMDTVIIRNTSITKAVEARTPLRALAQILTRTS